jgi:cell wall assembly regulator SMI1
MESYLEQLSLLIKEKRPELDGALLQGASLEDIKKLSNKIPDSLKNIWCWHNGQCQSYYGDFHSSTNEMLMSAEGAIECMKGFNEDVESGDISGENWKGDWLPFTENGGGNYMCVSLNTGEVFYYDKYETSTGIRYSSVQEWLVNLIDDYKKL